MRDIYSFLTFRKVEIIEKAEARAHNFDFKWQIQSERSFSGVKFNITSRNNWKPLFEVNVSKNNSLMPVRPGLLQHNNLIKLKLFTTSFTAPWLETVGHVPVMFAILMKSSNTNVPIRKSTNSAK